MSEAKPAVRSDTKQAMRDCPLLDDVAAGQFEAATKAAGRFSVAALRYLAGRSPDEKVAWLKVSVDACRTIFQPWVMETLYVLGTLGRARFNELQRLMGMSSRTLSNKLQELRAEGLVERDVFDEHPIRIEYFLTPAGVTAANLASPLVAHLNHEAMKRAGRA